MTNHKNYLAWVRHTYAGAWPKALLAIISLIAFGHLLAVLLFGVKWLDPSALLGNTIVAFSLAALGIFIKRKYPDS